VPLRPVKLMLLSPEPTPLKFPTKLLAALLRTLIPLKVLAAASDAAPRLTKAFDGVPAPVPPWSIESGVLNPDSEVISEFAPLAAAPRVVRAPVAVAGPVPPRVSGKVPLEILAAFKLFNADPSPVKPPLKESAGLLKVTAPEYVPANCEFGSVPLRPVKLML